MEGVVAMLNLNLLEDAWIPVVRRSGALDWIGPWQVSEGLLDGGDPVVRIVTPRADFDAALAQFLLALLQTAAAPGSPAGPAVWDDWLEEPPEPEQLREAFRPLSDVFQLAGETQRFLQDPTLLKEKSPGVLGVEEFFIESNETHFCKPGRIRGLCPACAATALFTLQTNAPEGGRGHYTSLRGGGPLTTLVAFDPHGNDVPDALWFNLWLNVLDAKELEGPDDRAAIFPWLDPARFIYAQRGRKVVPQDMHPLQMLWNMPRRIVLDEESCDVGTCDLCGADGPRFTHYLTRPNGVNYTGDPVWRHPWSPHNLVQREPPAYSPMHPQPGGLSYRIWPRLALHTPDSVPATVVRAYEGRDRRWEQLRLWSFGYDMKSNKARCWYESTVPIYLLAESEREAFSTRVLQWVEAAQLAAGFLRFAVKEAWFKRPADARGDLSYLDHAFFGRSEPDFYATVRALTDVLESGGEDAALNRQWHDRLCACARQLFEEKVERGGIEFSDPRRVAAAHQFLMNALYGPKMKKALALTTAKEKAA